MNVTAHDDSERRARRRVDIKVGLHVHATVFALVNAGLFAINSATGGESGHAWPLAGWGLGLAIHGIVTFVRLSGEGWRERLLDKERVRLRGRQ